MEAEVNNDKKNPANGTPDISNENARLGERIRQAYADVIDAPVPDRFLDLLKQLEEADKNKSEEG